MKDNTKEILKNIAIILGIIAIAALIIGTIRIFI
tara:strand:+ start:137 stop:238 length:102 start_codon:yes stop_codon:yes gene_type:complete